MPTNNPNAWRGRVKIARRVSPTVKAWIPANNTAGIWYYSLPRFLEQYDQVAIYASLDGLPGTLDGLQLRIQESDGVTRLMHQKFINIPDADTSQGKNPTLAATPTLPTTNQQQTITFDPSTTGGHYTLGFKSITSASQTYSPTATTAAAVQSVLQALSTIGSAANFSSRAVVSGPNGGPFTVQFFDTLLTSDVPLLVATDVDLTGTSHSVSVAAANTTGVVAMNRALRFSDFVRFGVKWSTASGNATNVILTMKAKG